MKYTKFLTILLASAFIFSCTKLDEELRDSLNAEASTVNAGGLLQSAYESMNSPLQDQARLWSSAEHTTDEALGPTRGPDWDDNGVWRVLHSHKWDADHGYLRDTYRELLSVQFSASTVLTKNPNPQQSSEARFIRALSTFYVLDGWDQVPYRTDLKDLTQIPPTIKGTGFSSLDFDMFFPFSSVFFKLFAISNKSGFCFRNLSHLISPSAYCKFPKQRFLKARIL
jgi:hypothetical protein